MTANNKGDNSYLLQIGYLTILHKEFQHMNRKLSMFGCTWSEKLCNDQIFICLNHNTVGYVLQFQDRICACLRMILKLNGKVATMNI